jgi:hypothetical protein
MTLPYFFLLPISGQYCSHLVYKNAEIDNYLIGIDINVGLHFNISSTLITQVMVEVSAFLNFILADQ